ncbi:hypothetical protein GCK32_020779 [Trichostrongylus colubriformis]|uniref:Uncharacterized protein n=1 Tax=Trichostrongylus colubriformis TaxID=6319 RepID=A0AAN8F1S8_TRICO
MYREKGRYSFQKCENRVPTLNEISRLNDPVLSEVFASSGIKKQKIRADIDDHPQLPPMAGSGAQVQPPVERPYGEVVIDHNQPLGPVPRGRDSMSEAVNSGVNALANGANALYRGATSVGQAFGFNPQAYEAPLFNAATQFLGKK